MNKIPTFFPNEADDSHCFQASLKMALNFIAPQIDKNIDSYDEFTGKSPSFKYTWPIEGAINSAKEGLEVVYIDQFDLRKFVKNPKKALIEVLGEEIAQDQIDNSNIPQVVSAAKALLTNENVKVIFEIPTLVQLQNLIDEGFAIIVNVNAKALTGKDGYSGHFVYVYGYTENSLLIHNPGLPPEPSLEITIENFEKAWAASGEEYKNILAIRSTNAIPTCT